MGKKRKIGKDKKKNDKLARKGKKTGIDRNRVEVA
jgi:hypothetical protein